MNPIRISRSTKRVSGREPGSPVRRISAAHRVFGTGMSQVISTRHLWWMLATAGGCYSYAVVPLDRVPTGVAVRARISAPQADRLEELLGHGDRQLEGRLVETGAESIILAVPAARDGSGVSSGRIHQRVTVPRAEIFEMEVRRLDRRRTAAVTLGLAALAAYLTMQQFGDSNENPGGSGKGGIDR